MSDAGWPVEPGEHMGVPRPPVLPTGQDERDREISSAAFAALANNQMGAVDIEPPGDYGPDDRAAFWREIDRWRQQDSGRGAGLDEDTVRPLSLSLAPRRESASPPTR